MINDLERREIAARLRELADANEGYIGMDRVNRVLRDGQAILGTSGLASVSDVLRRHADLIEPEPERTCRNNAPIYLHFLCSECGYVIYHDDVNETDVREEDTTNFCPNCGAEVVE